MRDEHATLRVLFYLVCLGIVYGSLFPFAFSLQVEQGVLAGFLGSWKVLPGRGDILGNIALFVPFGLLGRQLIERGEARAYTLSWLIMTWLVVAAGSQLGQFFLPSRDPAIFDLYTNVIGAAAGWWIAAHLPRLPVPGLSRSGLVHQVPVLLVFTWLAAMLVPFVPSVDLQSYKDALKPLLLAPHFVWYDSLLLASAWFTAFYLLQHHSELRLSRVQLAMVLLAVLFLQVIIVTRSVTLSSVVAMAAALGLWSLPAARRLSAGAVVGVLLFVLVLDGLAPFAPRPVPYGFGWLPFSGFLEGSMLSNTAALCRKTFLFGAIAWLVLRQRSAWPSRALLIAAVLLALEVAQTRLWSGTPEITDPLLFLAIAWYINRLPAAAPAPSRPRPRRAGAGIGVTLPGRRAVLLAVAVYALLFAVAARLVLGMRGVPYNLLELFRFDANGVDLVFFSLMLLSLGAGAAWLGRVIFLAGWSLWRVPLALLLASTLTYLLLWLAVTPESIRDIAGSTAFVHRVMERQVLGEGGVALFNAIGRDNAYAISKVFEPPLRLAALLGPFYIFLAVFSLPLWRARLAHKVGEASASRVLASSGLLLALLYLAKVVAFDWSSTDNLNELIAPEGDWGLGGGGYLYLLVALLCGLGALLASALSAGAGHRWELPRSAAAALLLLPVTWWLLNNGLGQDVGKYGYRFSGVDFLLGPDRANLLSTEVLFLRWSAVYVVAIGGIAFSVALCLRWFSPPPPTPAPAPGEVESAARQNVAPVAGPAPEPAGQELRLYQEQSVFLQHQASATGKSVNQLCNDILAYFAREVQNSADSAETVRDFLLRSGDTQGLMFAPLPVRIEFSEEARQTLDALKPDAQYSDSRAFRKLLQIFLEVAQQEGSDTGAVT